MSFTPIASSDFVVSSDSVTAPAWSTNAQALTTFFTASANLTSSYYLDVYNTTYNASNAAVQFAVAYGHMYGSGSTPLNSLVTQNTPSRITFGQYRNLIYGDSTAPVNFGTGNTSSLDLIAIPIDRNRYKGNLFPGTFNLQLAYGTGSRMLHLTNNSNDVSTITYLDCGRAYDIVSGSDGTSATALAISGVTRGYTASGSYGLFLPDIGLIVLNPKALQARPTEGGLGFNFNSLTTAALGWQNHDLIYQIINSGSAAGSQYSGFVLNSEETISSDYVFVRVKNAEYNYTSNPSMIDVSGSFIYPNFVNSPQTYMTTVGLYNTNNELLAVAKMSKPLVKDFTKESLVRVKLDW